MIRLFALILAAVLLIKHSPENDRAAISFNFDGKTNNFSGFSDTDCKFYQHHWPKQHTPETCAKDKENNKHVICGRFCSITTDTTVEFWIKWPKGNNATEEDILKLKKDTVWTLNSLRGKKNNFNKTTGQITGRSFQMLYFINNSEYLSDIEPLGFICLNEITKVNSELYSATGIFQCNVNGSGSDYKSKRMSKGKFSLQFYIGL